MKGISNLKMKTNENYHQISHIWISLNSKFQLQQTILIFSKKIPEKDYFWSETGKMSITIELFIFELM